MKKLKLCIIAVLFIFTTYPTFGSADSVTNVIAPAGISRGRFSINESFDGIN